MRLFYEKREGRDMKSTTPAMKRHISTIFTYCILGVAVLFIGFPVWWTVVTSFKDPVDVFTYPPRFVPFIDFKPTLEHWFRILFPRGIFGWELSLAEHGTEIFGYLTNSLVVASCSSLLTIVIGSFAGFSLARFQYKRWKNQDMAFFILSQRFLPPVAVVIPFFIMFKVANMLDTWQAVIIVHTAMNLPYAVWMMRVYFSEVPKELEESALVDGCSILHAFARIVLPISAPGLVATTIICFIFSWNEYLFALFLTFSKALTMPCLVAGLTHSGAPLWWDISTMTIVCILPPILFALAVQRYIVKGLTLGAVKG